MLHTHRLALASLATSVASAAVICGDNQCSSQEYCSESMFCNSCHDICVPSSHNYDEHTCKEKCRDYLSSQYVSREELNAEISRVYAYVMVSLVISVLVLLLVLSAFFTVWLRYRRMRCYNDKTLKKKMETIKAVCVNEVDGSKKLKLEMPVPVPNNKDTTPPSALTTMTPLSTRHPSEDATLEYAYDNPTLMPSPVFGKNQPQSTPNVTPKKTRTETSF